MRILVILSIALSMLAAMPVHAENLSRVELGGDTFSLFGDMWQSKVEQPANISEDRNKIWTDREGRQIRAVFYGLFDDKVTLLRDDGQRFTLPLATLSDRDAIYVRIISLGLSFDQEGFFKAARHGNEKTLELFDAAGITPSTVELAAELVKAAGLGNLDYCQLLLKHGAGTDQYDASGRLPLLAAARSGKLKAISLLMNHGARADQREPATGLTAVEWALTKRNRAIMEALLQAGPECSPRIAWAVKAYRDGDLETVGADSVVRLVQWDMEAVFDPNDTGQAAHLYLLLIGYDLSAESFYRALAAHDLSLLELYLEAGVMERLDFRVESALWGLIWSVCVEGQREVLLDAAGIDEADQLLLRARCMNLSSLVDHARRLQVPARPKVAAPVVAANPKEWAGGTSAQRQMFDYMRAHYPDMGKPDMSGFELRGHRERQTTSVDQQSLTWIQGGYAQPRAQEQSVSIDWNPEPLPGMPGATCAACGGDGVCPACHGTGGIMMYGGSSLYGQFKRCASCNGTGRCQWCRGTGKQ